MFDRLADHLEAPELAAELGGFCTGPDRSGCDQMLRSTASHSLHRLSYSVGGYQGSPGLAGR